MTYLRSVQGWICEANFFLSLWCLRAEVGISAAIIAAQACGLTILLAITLAPQLFLNGCADAYAASILAILRAIAHAQFKYSRLGRLFFHQM